MQATQVVVIGGGYSGVMAANRLTQREGLEITLINPRADFIERIRLHQAVSGTGGATVDFSRVLSDECQLVVDSVARIDVPRREVILESGGSCRYDYLIYAVGSEGAASSIPGVTEFAYPLSTHEDAERLRRAVETAPEQSPVAVIGAGPTGIETAAELAQAGRAVTLVCGDVLGPYFHPRARRAVRRRLQRSGVQVIEGPGARVTEATPGFVRLEDGREEPSLITVWTAGFGVPQVARHSGLATDDAGRLLTDEFLTSVDDERILAAGDCAAPKGQSLRMSCQAAMPLGAQAADNLLRSLDGTPRRRVDQGFVSQCVSLGRRAGVVQFARRNDTATAWHLAGRTGAGVKEMICRLTIRQLTVEARKPGSLRWVGSGEQS